VAMQEAVINFCRVTYNTYARLGKQPPRSGSKSVNASAAPTGIYPCRGGGDNDYCYIHATGGRGQHWERLLAVMGREELLDDPRFATPRAGFDNRDELDEIISGWTRQHAKREVMELIGAAGVPCGAVFDNGELQSDPALRKRGM